LMVTPFLYFFDLFCLSVTLMDVSMVSFFIACCLYIVALYVRVCDEWIFVSYIILYDHY
jgi:hypothetical protein